MLSAKTGTFFFFFFLILNYQVDAVSMVLPSVPNSLVQKLRNTDVGSTLLFKVIFIATSS